MSTMLHRIRIVQRGELRAGGGEFEALKVEHWAKTASPARGRRAPARRQGSVRHGKVAG
jgi:hypothetical protein